MVYTICACQAHQRAFCLPQNSRYSVKPGCPGRLLANSQDSGFFGAKMPRYKRGSRPDKRITTLYGADKPTEEQIRLAGLVSAYGTLKAVSDKIGVNVGFLSAIKSGRRRASNSVRTAMGMHKRSELVEVCDNCGTLRIDGRHKCPHKKPEWLAVAVASLRELEKRAQNGKA